MNMIIGRRQIILAALVLALGAAIFLNYHFSQTGKSTDLTGLTSKTSNLGDATYVDNQKLSSKATSYFAQARLSRTQSRDQAKETLASVESNSSTSSSQKQEAQEGIKQIATNIQSENAIENIVKAKGFSDCVCFINAGQANVVVATKSTSTLSASDAIQIKDIVMNQSKLSADNIKIIQVN
ncbi:MAG TPA: SpoIIIAH-like family protein [Clostridia bacterium]|nr:SpoIIIAH-like family protein [Clostridia bacterium]